MVSPAYTFTNTLLSSELTDQLLIVRNLLYQNQRYSLRNDGKYDAAVESGSNEGVIPCSPSIGAVGAT